MKETRDERHACRHDRNNGNLLMVTMTNLALSPLAAAQGQAQKAAQAAGRQTAADVYAWTLARLRDAVLADQPERVKARVGATLQCKFSLIEVLKMEKISAVFRCPWCGKIFIRGKHEVQGNGFCTKDKIFCRNCGEEVEFIYNKPMMVLFVLLITAFISVVYVYFSYCIFVLINTNNVGWYILYISIVIFSQILISAGCAVYIFMMSYIKLKRV
jgi:predicted RNA-binding Zn-ribbon protein involved in translation (DUF1610 family)